MPLYAKITLWVPIFLLNILLATGVYIYNYVTLLFDMPLDIWNELNNLQSDEADD